MSRIAELKKQNPGCNMTLIDCLSLLFGKTKYIDLYLKFDKDYKQENPYFEQELDDYFRSNELESILTIDDLSTYDKFVLYKFTNSIFNTETIRIMNTFIDLNERNLIEQNDITKYKSLDDLTNQVSLAQLKTVGKDLERFIIKLRDDEEWLILKPLSWESSKKYGANTKWCTTSSDNSDYFYKYSRNGVLIYMINKKTGYKVALHKEMGESITFWNQKDQRIDSMETILPEDIKSFLFGYCNNKDIKPNYDYLHDEEKLEIEKSINTPRTSLRVVPIAEVPVEYPEDEIELNIQAHNQPDLGELQQAIISRIINQEIREDMIQLFNEENMTQEDNVNLTGNITGNFTLNTTGTATVVHMGDTWVTNTTLDVERD